MTENISIDAAKKKWFDENYAEIKQNIKNACEKVGKKEEDIILLAATKTVEPTLINYAISKGINYIGENRVQEFISKKDDIDPSAHRHFIGTLQSNKIKYIIGEVEMIQSVSSIKLANEISKAALKNKKVMDILLEVNIGDEESKSGFSAEELEKDLKEIARLEGVRVLGLMSIPPICDQKSDICKYFNKMQKLFIDIRGQNIDNVDMKYLSMGMSDDYKEAIECGANIVRIGTALFGKRNYLNIKEN